MIAAVRHRRHTSLFDHLEVGTRHVLEAHTCSAGHFRTVGDVAAGDTASFVNDAIAVVVAVVTDLLHRLHVSGARQLARTRVANVVTELALAHIAHTAGAANLSSRTRLAFAGSVVAEVDGARVEVVAEWRYTHHTDAALGLRAELLAVAKQSVGAVERRALAPALPALVVGRASELVVTRVRVEHVDTLASGGVAVARDARIGVGAVLLLALAHAVVVARSLTVHGFESLQ